MADVSHRDLASAAIRMLSREDDSEAGRIILQGLPVGAIEVLCDRLDKHAASARMLVHLAKKFDGHPDDRIELVVRDAAKAGNPDAQAIMDSGLLDERGQ